jgi:hypothetical protein
MNLELQNSDRQESALPQKIFLLQNISDDALATLRNMRTAGAKILLGL